MTVIARWEVSQAPASLQHASSRRRSHCGLLETGGTVTHVCAADAERLVVKADLSRQATKAHLCLFRRPQTRTPLQGHVRETRGAFFSRERERDIAGSTSKTCG